MRDRKVIDEIFLSFRAQLARMVSRIAPPDQVEDIVQETYVRACQTTLTNEAERPKAVMVTIARNLARDHLRRAEFQMRARPGEAEEIENVIDIAGASDPLRNAISNEEFGLFCEAVRLLPAQCRRVFVLKKVYGFSQREIARKLEISENTVEKHVAKGMRHCANFMTVQGASSGSMKADQTPDPAANGALRKRMSHD